MIVVLSYRQTCHAYPNGGGAYAVSRANLGRNASLVAASALLVDYVLTVAVSVAAGVANIVSAVPSLADHAVLLSVGMIVVLALMNLRGVKESGTVFAIPTYGFILCVFCDGRSRAVAGCWRAPHRSPSRARSALRPRAAAVWALLVVVGAACLRLGLHRADRRRGSEQRRPQLPGAEEQECCRHARDHGRPDHCHVRRHHRSRSDRQGARGRGRIPPGRSTGRLPPTNRHRPDRGAVFGADSIGFFLVQGFTAAILVLAANTAFNGFPILASILARMASCRTSWLVVATASCSPTASSS